MLPELQGNFEMKSLGIPSRYIDIHLHVVDGTRLYLEHWYWPRITASKESETYLF